MAKGHEDQPGTLKTSHLDGLDNLILLEMFIIMEVPGNVFFIIYNQTRYITSTNIFFIITNRLGKSYQWTGT